MVEGIALAVVGLAGLYLTVLGVLALAAPTQAVRFLLGFAATRSLHLLEILCRVVVGAALIVAGPALVPSPPFVVFGWLLLGTSALLLAVPWRWHRKFAGRAVPLASRYIALIGIVSLVGAGFLVVALLRANVPGG